MAKLLDVYVEEQRREGGLGDVTEERVEAVLNVLVDGAMEDLTAATDFLDHWGLIAESCQYRNFHLVPALLGQAVGYLLRRSPGPAASRLQAARRSFPKDDLLFREFIFAKCWEQGMHRTFGAWLLSDQWEPLKHRLEATFGEVPT